jgi:hypothetical protein
MAVFRASGGRALKNDRSDLNNDLSVQLGRLPAKTPASARVI